MVRCFKMTVRQKKGHEFKQKWGFLNIKMRQNSYWAGEDVAGLLPRLDFKGFAGFLHVTFSDESQYLDVVIYYSRARFITENHKHDTFLINMHRSCGVFNLK